MTGLPPQQLGLLPLESGGDAVIEGPYRYQLRRWWSSERRALLWVLLNPSTATETSDDATLRRLIAFTRREGYSALIVVNLYAWRSKSPQDLAHAENAVGEQNDRHIQEAVQHADKIVVAWGAHPAVQKRDQAVLALIKQPVWCLGTSRQGQPRHPLYLPAETPLVPFPYSLQR